ncbi:MAG: hypothetical protein ACTTHI_06170, partial [Prevotella sp.]
GDTRIFSPLLYQLSYGTLFVCGCKDRNKIWVPQIFGCFSSTFLGRAVRDGSFSADYLGAVFFNIFRQNAYYSDFWRIFAPQYRKARRCISRF